MDCLMINSSDWTALTLTFELALISTIILLVIGTPIAWWLSQTKVRFKFLIETISLISAGIRKSNLKNRLE